MDPWAIPHEYGLSIPPGMSLRNNILKAQKHHLDFIWFYNMVHKGGEWDYKKGGMQYENFGNFHFGIVGTAAGYSPDVLLRMAGMAQKMDGTSRPEYGFPLGKPPYGDEPKDQYWIKQGINYYNSYIEKFNPHKHSK